MRRGIVATQVVKPQWHDEPAGGVGERNDRTMLARDQLGCLRELIEIGGHVIGVMPALAVAVRAAALVQIDRVERVALCSEVISDVRLEEIVLHAVDPHQGGLSRRGVVIGFDQNGDVIALTIRVRAQWENCLGEPVAEDVYVPVQRINFGNTTCVQIHGLHLRDEPQGVATCVDMSARGQKFVVFGGN